MITITITIQICIARLNSAVQRRLTMLRTVKHKRDHETAQEQTLQASIVQVC